MDCINWKSTAKGFVPTAVVQPLERTHHE